MGCESLFSAARTSTCPLGRTQCPPSFFVMIFSDSVREGGLNSVARDRTVSSRNGGRNDTSPSKRPGLAGRCDTRVYWMSFRGRTRKLAGNFTADGTHPTFPFGHLAHFQPVSGLTSHAPGRAPRKRELRPHPSSAWCRVADQDEALVAGSEFPVQALPGSKA
jgi:hypothetical protein